MSYYKSDAEQIQDLADAQLNRYLDSLEEDVDPRDILEEQSKCDCCEATLYTEDYRDSDFDHDVESNQVWVFCMHCDESTELKVKK